MMKLIILIILILLACNPNPQTLVTLNTISKTTSVQIGSDEEPILLVKKNKIMDGDSFGKILHGFLDPNQIQDVYKESKKVYDLRRIRKNHEYRIFFQDSTFYRFEYDIDSKGFYQITKESNSFNYEVILYEFLRDTVYADIKVNEMVFEDVQSKGIESLLAIHLANVYAWDIDFTYDIQKDDHFHIFYEKLYLNSEYKGIGDIISAKYINGTDTMDLFRYSQSGNTEYFDAEGNNVKKAFLKAPVDFKRISSGFSYRRYHPILKKYKSHFGTDYAAAKNTPVYAIADGKIAFRGYKKYNGNNVHIRHKGGFESKYLHFNSIPKSIRKNKYVKQGDVIGYIGKTGLATGYHVCFRFYLNGYPYNFAKVKNPISSKLNQDEIEPFLSYKSQYLFNL